MASVEQIARLLSLFVDETELGAREVGRRLGIGKSSAHRLATQLAEVDLLDKHPETGRYRLGIGLLELGGLVQSRLEVAEVAEPVLNALMRSSNETIHLTILDGLEIVHVAKVDSTHTIRSFSRIGWRGPVHCTSAGKVILAHREPALLDRVLRLGLRRYTPRTITDPAKLRAELQVVRRRGYAFNDDEREIGERGVAAPVRDYTGQVVAAISVVGPTQRMSDEKLHGLVGPVLAAAADVSRRLGWRGAQDPDVPR